VALDFGPSMVLDAWLVLGPPTVDDGMGLAHLIWSDLI